MSDLLPATDGLFLGEEQTPRRWDGSLLINLNANNITLGELDPTRYPNALLLDGSRTMTGALKVGEINEAVAGQGIKIPQDHILRVHSMVVGDPTTGGTLLIQSPAHLRTSKIEEAIADTEIRLKSRDVVIDQQGDLVVENSGIFKNLNQTSAIQVDGPINDYTGLKSVNVEGVKIKDGSIWQKETTLIAYERSVSKATTVIINRFRLPPSQWVRVWIVGGYSDVGGLNQCVMDLLGPYGVEYSKDLYAADGNGIYDAGHPLASFGWWLTAGFLQFRLRNLDNTSHLMGGFIVITIQDY